MLTVSYTVSQCFVLTDCLSVFVDSFDPDEMFYEHAPESRQSDSLSDSDSDDAYGERKRAQVHYVYDAAAERTQQRIKEGLLAVAALERVH